MQRCSIMKNTVLILLSLIGGVNSLAIDNNVIGEPQVQCSEDSVTFSFRSRNRFTGNIFIKGKYNNPACRQEYFQNNFNGASYGVKIGDCGMRRVRQLQPHGMNYVLVFIVNFHSQFITKVDRAYNVRCFYAQADKTVTAQLDVSMLTTTELNAQTVIMPNCQYSVRSGTLNGPKVRFSRVGDRLVHRWECDNPAFGMLVKNCFVNDGQGSSVRVLDSRGCPIFTPVVQGTLNYDNGLNLAYVEVWAYKFPDRSNLFFQCQIQVCHKRENECIGVTPPNCPLVLKSEFESGSVSQPGVDATQTQIRGSFSNLNPTIPDDGASLAVLNPGPDSLNNVDGPYGAPPIYPRQNFIAGPRVGFQADASSQKLAKRAKQTKDQQLPAELRNDSSIPRIVSPSTIEDKSVFDEFLERIENASRAGVEAVAAREAGREDLLNSGANKFRRALADEMLPGQWSLDGEEPEVNPDELMDVTAEVMVIDIDESEEEGGERGSILATATTPTEADVCLNPTSLGLLMTALAFLVVIIVLLLIYILHRSSKDKAVTESLEAHHLPRHSKILPNPPMNYAYSHGSSTSSSIIGDSRSASNEGGGATLQRRRGNSQLAAPGEESEPQSTANWLTTIADKGFIPFRGSHLGMNDVAGDPHSTWS